MINHVLFCYIKMCIMNILIVMYSQLPTGECLVVYRAGYLEFYEISYLWYTLFAVVVVNVVGTIVSFLTGIYQGVVFASQTLRDAT